MPTDHAQQHFEIACTEHAPVEVHLQFEDGFASVIAARLLAQGEGTVTVEFTGASDDLGDVRIGNRYTATFESEGETLAFQFHFFLVPVLLRANGVTGNATYRRTDDGS